MEDKNIIKEHLKAGRQKKRAMYMKMILSSLLRRRSRMIVALLAIIIGATVFMGMMTVYMDIPRQMGNEFRSYGANLIIVPNGGEKHKQRTI